MLLGISGTEPFFSVNKVPTGTYEVVISVYIASRNACLE
jgi:hypothetical protein